MEELYRQTDRYSMLEDNIRASTQTAMIINQPAEGNKSSGKKPSESKDGQNKNRKRSRDQLQKKRELPQFTPLNVSYERLLPIIRDLPKFKWPTLIQTDPSQRNKSLQCNYHRDHGHDTNRYRSLKFMVEKLITARHLGRYIREIDHELLSGQAMDRVTAAAASSSESRSAINYILGGPSDNHY